MRVLELSCGAAAGYAGALLAELGCCVDRIDCADPAVAAQDVNAEQARQQFLHHAKNALAPSSPVVKTSADIDPAGYDVVVEDVGARGLRRLGWSYGRLQRAHSQLTLVSLSPFGLTGAYKDWLGSDLLAQAVGGVMHVCGYEGEPPMMLPGEAAYMIAGLHGATAALSGVYAAGEDPLVDGQLPGIHIDISAQDTFMQHWIRHVAEYAYSGVPMGRQVRDPEGLHYRHTAQARDGWVYLLALREPWQDLAAFLGLGEHLPADAFEPGGAQPEWHSMESAFHDAVAGKSKYQWFADAAELGWTFAPVEDPFAVAASPQVAARGGMGQTRDSVQIPPLPWTISR